MYIEEVVARQILDSRATQPSKSTLSLKTAPLAALAYHQVRAPVSTKPLSCAMVAMLTWAKACAKPLKT